MRRIVVAVVAVVSMVGFTVILGGAAGGGSSSQGAVLDFNNSAKQVTLTIPTPACPPTQSTCVWKLFVNEPLLPSKPVVGSVTGTSGVLTVAYPTGFCGVIQADAQRGVPFPNGDNIDFEQIVGRLHTIDTGNGCKSSPTTTMASSPPPTASTTPPVAGSVAAGSVPPPAASATAPPPGIVPSAPDGTQTSAPPSARATATSAQLPFTGVNTKPFVFIGLTLVVLGLVLITASQSWRRMARRLWWRSMAYHRHSVR